MEKGDQYEHFVESAATLSWMHTDLRFHNWEIATANRKSQAAQDLFVLCATHGQKEGTFLEIGASDAKELSNTYILERFFNWQGVSLDIDVRSKLSFLRHGRKSKFILKDATKFDYRRVERAFPTSLVIDYLSLDIEPMTNTLKALKQVMAAGLTFRVITYETDFYDMQIDRQTAERVRSESRQILSDAGYSLVAGDVCVQEGGAPFEDWWVRADLIDAERLSKIMDTFSDGMSGDALLGVVYRSGGTKLKLENSNVPRQWSLVGESTEMQFLESCLKMASSPDAFEEFRRDGGLRPILEGGSQATLSGNLRRITDSGGNDWLMANLGDFKKNDEVGRPFVFSNTVLGVLSPSVVQYASQLWDIVRYLKPENLNRVVEVGGGYGGLARILSSQLRPREYVLVDHPNVLALAQVYLGRYNSGTSFRYVSCFDTKSMEQLGPIDLFVSVAAMAELSQTQQELYNSLLLKRAESFSVVYNTLHLRSGRSSFVSIASNWGEFKVDSEVTWENAISMIGRKSNSTKPNRLLRAFSLFSSIVPNFIRIRVLSFLVSRN